MSGVSGLGLVQVYTLISPGRSGRCLRSCTKRRNLVASLAGYELKRPYICRLTMGGLKTREWLRYQPGLRTSTDPILSFLGRSCGLVVKAPASEAGGPVFESLKRFGLEVRYDGSPLKRAAISASFK